MAIGATAIWRVRPSGVNTNGGGYDPGIAGAATDYSQQNAAQASGTNGSTSGAGSTTFTDATAAAFTSAMIGNCIQIASGTNFQAGFYFVTAFTNANSVVLDRTPSSGGAGSAGVWKLGGGWRDFWTNNAAPVPGNTVFILGSGTPNPASYTYDYSLTSAVTVANGAFEGDKLLYANDPQTPGYKAFPDTTGGMPTIKGPTSGGYIFNVTTDIIFKGLWFVCASGNTDSALELYRSFVLGCVFDQFGNDANILGTGQAAVYVAGCEVFSSVGAGAGSSIALAMAVGFVDSCNVHDVIGGGIYLTRSSLTNTIVAKCGTFGVQLDSPATNTLTGMVQNNTIDGNAGHGVEIKTQSALAYTLVVNNIISNHTTVGKFGMTVDAGTTADNDRVKGLVDYQVFYNNNSDVNAISYGAHDTHGGSNPYVGQSTENYTLA